MKRMQTDQLLGCYTTGGDNPWFPTSSGGHPDLLCKPKGLVCSTHQGPGGCGSRAGCWEAVNAKHSPSQHPVCNKSHSPEYRKCPLSTSQTRWNDSRLGLRRGTRGILPKGNQASVSFCFLLPSPWVLLRNYQPWQGASESCSAVPRASLGPCHSWRDMITIVPVTWLGWLQMALPT